MTAFGVPDAPSAPWLRSGALIITALLCGCRYWGTLEDGQKLFENNADAFARLHRIVGNLSEMAREEGGVWIHSPGFFFPFAETYISSGRRTSIGGAASDVPLDEISATMDALGLTMIRIFRFPGRTTGEVEIVDFVPAWAGRIAITRIEGNHSIHDYELEGEICRSLEAPSWYVCEGPP